jgi:hypothetical protein
VWLGSVAAAITTATAAVTATTITATAAAITGACAIRAAKAAFTAATTAVTAAAFTTTAIATTTFAVAASIAATAPTITPAAAAATATVSTPAAAFTTTAVAATTTAKTTCARWAGFHRTGFIHHDAATTQGLTVHALDGGLCFGIAAHFDKTKAFGATGVTLHHDFCAGYSTKSCKSLLQIAITYRVGQIAHIQFVAHCGTPQKHKNKAMESRKRNQLWPWTPIDAFCAKLTDHRKPFCRFKNLQKTLCATNLHKKQALTHAV